MGHATDTPWWKKLAWFVVLWAGGVLAVYVLALLVKLAYPAG